MSDKDKLKELHEEVSKTFETLKEYNDQAIAEAEARGGEATAETREIVDKVNDELTALEPALLTPNVGEAVFHPADGEGEVHGCAKRVGDEVYLIAVNPNEEPVTVSLALADLGVEATGPAEIMFEDRSVAIADGAIKDEFEGLAVHVYRLTR